MPNDSINTVYNQLKFDKKKADSISELFKKINSNNEFEVMFYNYKSDKSNLLSMENFLTILEYLKKRSLVKKELIQETTVLDISYGEDLVNYRISVDGIDNIENYLSFVHRRKNHVIFKILLGKMLAGDKSITLIKKIKNMDNIIDIDEYNTRFRLSDEVQATPKEIDKLKELDETSRHKIVFRYKQRVSLFVKQTKNEVLRVDLTNIKQNDNINKIDTSIAKYELELDFAVLGKLESTLNDIYKEIEIMHKIIQQSNFIVNSFQENAVLQDYRSMLAITDKKSVTLDGRKAQSLEIQHVVDILPNKYAVTDKADGERCFLIISNNHVYLITDTLHVKDIGINLDSKLSKYNQTILDGEYIFLPKHNRHIYMSFDCLYRGGEDIRKVSSLMDRIKEADKVVRDCFILKGQKGFDIKEYKSKFDIDAIMKFHSKQITDFMDAFDHDIRKEKMYPLVRRKYFIEVYGGQDNEIFKYSQLMWNKYVIDPNTKCPYILDGLIYHPLEQKYASVKDSKFFEYKWKPEDKNSIDFFIKFERDVTTNSEYILFDNSHDDQVKGKPYKICHLYVGKKGKYGEQPTLFQKENNKYIAYLFLDNGEVRDQSGNIVKDNTVVEFYYVMDSKLDEKYRWIPMRTRYDKTESVMLHKRRYGNYIDIANKVWRSIINPFIMKDIMILSKDSQYRQHIDVLRNKIDHSLILSERKENIYYQIRTNLAKPMRNFHNWIKSIVIYTYCNQAYERGKKQVVLDIGSGRGGDLMKFYYTKVALYIGIDIDAENLLSAVDGAVSRYEQLRRTHPNFPKMSFVQADGGILLDYDHQVTALGGMSTLNKSIMEKHFSADKNKRTIFDRINCQFAVHYFLSDDTTWNNFCKNIEMYLKQGGYIIFTCFDGQEISKLLKDTDKYTSYYTNDNGEKKVMFDIIKKYDDSEVKQGTIGLGTAIDFHNAIDFQEDVYMTEYLVDKEFITKELYEKCDLELIETDLFANQFHIHADFFKHIYKYEENKKTREFFRKAAEFYNQSNSVNKAGFELTKLNRYYVFRRKETESGTKKQKGGFNETDSETTDYDALSDASYDTEIDSVINSDQIIEKLDDHEYILGEGEYYIKPKYSYKNNTFQEGLFNVMQDNKYIPNNISMNGFYDDMGVDLVIDDELNDNSITNISKKIRIDHEVEGDTTNVINGLNFIVLEKDCDGDLSVLGYGKKKKINKKDKTIVFYKNGHDFFPVHNKEMENIFDSKQKFIKKLFAEL